MPRRLRRRKSSHINHHPMIINNHHQHFYYHWMNVMNHGQLETNMMFNTIGNRKQSKVGDQ
ncbi:hypothetical protein HUG17_2776 [Dermatophagoides farinae]|uniref:Uncharacterized protein n=1 Tax=Dermatophagoides farinae TaxID=6954 RepID=A0A9D4NUW8_DERFA|nr:hypothetical protein HUG17_2776 [Dermatophagoides farinae]